MIFQTPQWIDSIPSTNSALLQQLKSGAQLPSGTVLATADQTAGRGRGAHVWQTRPGRDLASSFVLHSSAGPSDLCSLSMAVALGVADLLDELGVAGTQTKWPNDVIVGNRKICGILPELSPSCIVVGVGLNVGMSPEEAAAIDQPATSVLIETGEEFDPQDLVDRLLTVLSPRLDLWMTDGFGALRRDWEQRSAGLGQMVAIVDGDTRREGVLQGFGDSGQLRLASEGDVVDVWSGHLRLGHR